MQLKPTILILIKPFWIYAKHKPKMDTIKALEKVANVHYWHVDGHISDIINKLQIQPDFIFHYDIAWNHGLAPEIEGLSEVEIPKGCFVIDLHWKPEERRKYIEENKVDLIFSATKHPFLKVFPEYETKLRWLPWAINPKVMKDWKQEKTIDALLMGLVYVDENNRGKHPLPEKIPPEGRYAFRDTVFNVMREDPRFVFHPHPGHRVKRSTNLMVDKKYAKELNRAKIFYTCGSRSEIGGVAVLKFFEAPACNTLLLAEANEEIEALGFIDGVNYVACTTENIVEKTSYYLANEEERNRIARNGYKFVHSYHTNHKRANQMLAYISPLLQDPLN
ncbi:glycosyltransferase family protein [Oceanobacillus manasiensis]|uniref:glycosyltransferase family protein n=1 Tax=Oceanobacillus manasiensis TaxID=586413 RepID=UPI0005AB687E|nr:glycosyltransferase [Oceanobacillus manasiensis]